MVHAQKQGDFTDSAVQKYLGTHHLFIFSFQIARPSCNFLSGLVQ